MKLFFSEFFSLLHPYVILSFSHLLSPCVHFIRTHTQHTHTHTHANMVPRTLLFSHTHTHTSAYTRTHRRCDQFTEIYQRFSPLFCMVLACSDTSKFPAKQRADCVPSPAGDYLWPTYWLAYLVLPQRILDRGWLHWRWNLSVGGGHHSVS